MRRYSTEGIVLKNINYKDAHKIYTIFTKDYGKISAVAMGVRKITSKRAGNLDTLNRVTVSISEDTKGFKTIQEVKTQQTYIEIKKDLKKMYHGFYIIDLINSFFDYDSEDRKSYELVEKTLDALAKYPRDNQHIVNYFEYALTDFLGFRLEIGRCVRCGRQYDLSWKKITYIPQEGGIFCDKCNTYGMELNNDAIKAMNSLRKCDLKAIEEGSIWENVDRILKLHIKNLPEKKFHISKIEAFSR